MPLVARASHTVRNKNILILIMCLGFLAWFGYDGWVAYPAANDRIINNMKTMIANNQLSTIYQDTLAAWPGWNKASPAQRQKLSTIAEEENIENWKSPKDIQTQQWIVLGLAIAAVAAIWWLIHCQRRRAIADDNSVSPAPGVVIPWDKIKVVDNTRWKSSGIVEITYVDDVGKERKAKFDDYELAREPLLNILDKLAEKAGGAEFLPRESPATGDDGAAVPPANPPEREASEA